MTPQRPRQRRKTVGKTSQPKVSQAQAAEVFRQHAEGLRKRGAHAMRLTADAKGPVIEVYVPEDFKGTLPSTVGTTMRGKKLDLRIEAKKTPRFKPEKL